MPKNKHVLIISLFLILATAIAFGQVGNHGFVDYDDNEYVAENRHIRDGITVEGLRWAFTTGHASNWHPLTWISHMLDVQFFGLRAHFHHLTNLLIHIANVLLVFLVFRRMTKALWQSAFVAALFALHPLHVESVAWIAERKDVLSTFFGMLTLAAYGYYAEKPRLKSYLAVLAFFALGLTAKPMLVTLPFVLLLLDYWPLERFGKNESTQAVQITAKGPAPSFRKKGKPGKQPPKITVEMDKPAGHRFQWALIYPLVLEKIPLFILAALSCAATYIAQKSGGTVAPFEVFTPGMRISNAFVSYLIYMGKTIWPNNLAVYYPHPGLRPSGQVLGAILFLALVSFAVVVKAKRYPYLLVGWLWFTGTLVPVIGFVQVGGQALADRYTYIPSIGLFIMAAWGIPEIFKRRRYGKELLAVSSVLCLLCFLILTWIQTGYWRDSITLFDHALNVTENNAPMHNNRGNVLHSVGNYTGAIGDFNRAIEINPSFAAAYNGRGLAYHRMGNNMRSIEDFDRALEINPRYAGAYNSRGLAYYSMRSYSRSIEDFDKAIRIDKELAPAYNNRGNARDCLGDRNGAVEDFNRAIEINPEYADAYNNRGIAYEGMGNHVRAINDFDRAIAINPGYTQAYYNRGSVQASLGNEKQALEDMKTAAGLGYEDAKNYLKSTGVDWQ
jgi:protein O-mannosyl-transferase